MRVYFLSNQIIKKLIYFFRSWPNLKLRTPLLSSVHFDPNKPLIAHWLDVGGFKGATTSLLILVRPNFLLATDDFLNGSHFCETSISFFNRSTWWCHPSLLHHGLVLTCVLACFLRAGAVDVDASIGVALNVKTFFRAGEVQDICSHWRRRCAGALFY